MNVCPVCSEDAPPGWLVCEACSREVPASLHTAWQCARGHAHAAVGCEKPSSAIALAKENERVAAQRIISHLKLHGTAL